MVHGIRDVVERGMCIGCGACAVRTSGAVPVTLNGFGMYEADLSGAGEADLAAADRVCPFSDASKDEDALARERHGHLPLDARLGRHLSIHAGRVADEARILGSSSGGLTSWLLERLLEEGHADGVIHVGRGQDADLFDYTISRTAAELRATRKSVYSSTTAAEVLRSVRGDGLRYVVVGVPCFLTAMRHLCDEDDTLRGQLTLFVGLVCGHLKSRFFGESLGWQAGIPPQDLASVDFRVKNPRRRAYAYDYEAASRKGGTRRRSVASTIDGDWAYGAFQPEACNFCDDIFAESADVVLGDAWLPEYTGTWQGTNIVITRDERARRVLADGVAEGAIVCETLSADDAARSQAGNLRHRRDGLRVRLADDLARGLSVPRKRVEPGYAHVSAQRVALIRQRRLLSALSLRAFTDAKAAGRFGVYRSVMRRETRRYRSIERAGMPLGGRLLAAARAWRQRHS